jgi:hypothetical protein
LVGPFGCGPVSVAYSAYTIATALELLNFMVLDFMILLSFWCEVGQLFLFFEIEENYEKVKPILLFNCSQFRRENPSEFNKLEISLTFP